MRSRHSSAFVARFSSVIAFAIAKLCGADVRLKRGVYRALTYIEGATPGDAIAITFRRMRLNRNWGYTNYRLGVFSLTPASIEALYPNKYKENLVIPGRSNAVPWDLDLAKGTVRLREPRSRTHAMEFPARPMLGCVGVAAPGDFGAS